MLDVKSVFVSALADAKSRIEYAKADMAKLKTQRRALGRVLKPIVAAMRGDDVIFVGGAGDRIFITMRNLPGFKCLELETMLTALENLGECRRTKDYAEYYSRDFVYDVSGIEVNLSAYVRSNSETCRRVPVGETVIRQTKYEMVCE